MYFLFIFSPHKATSQAVEASEPLAIIVLFRFGSQCGHELCIAFLRNTRFVERERARTVSHISSKTLEFVSEAETLSNLE